MNSTTFMNKPYYLMLIDYHGQRLDVRKMQPASHFVQNEYEELERLFHAGLLSPDVAIVCMYHDDLLVATTEQHYA